jgi:putative oxidoreductase
MLRDAVAPMAGWGMLPLRIAVGLVFIVHGAQKLFVNGFGGVAGYFQTLGIPAPMLAAVVVTLVELLGGIALVLGLFTRWAALLLAIDMLVALFVVHLPKGFFISAGGYEFVLTLLGACLTLLLVGPGEAAIDRADEPRRL